MPHIRPRPIHRPPRRQFSGYLIPVRSRHPSHRGLMEGTRLPFRSVVRFGSTTIMGDGRTHCNTVDAIRNCADKLRMKQIFAQHNIKSPKFWTTSVRANMPNPIPYPIVAKIFNHSRGRGMVRIMDVTEHAEFIRTHNENNYTYEEYFKHSREYRIHVSPHIEGEIFSIRKMIRQEAADNGTWSRNIQNGAFVREFERPAEWPQMVEECKRACAALGLDIGAADILYSVKNKSFTIVEINSAPAMRDRTREAYKNAIIQILKHKHGIR